MNMTVELLPCPFCGKDELTAEPETTYVMCHGCDADGPMTRPGDAIKAWNTRAPAEDVRAEVEETVHQWSDDEGISWCDGNERSLQSAQESGWMIRTLYRHPQRPVVLPERMVVPATRSIQGPLHIAYDVAAGYNACLDEVERLNK